MTHRLDPSRSTLSVWTKKEGLLSKVAHDLRIDATRLEVDLAAGDGWRVEVTVPVDGLRVRGQVKGGEVLALSDKDHREIEANLAGAKVLDAARHPAVRYAGEGRRAGDEVTLTGRLTIRGTTREVPLRARAREEDGGLRVEGEVTLRQTDFGVTPYSALLGALKVQDALRVSWSLRFEEAA